MIYAALFVLSCAVILDAIKNRADTWKAVGKWLQQRGESMMARRSRHGSMKRSKNG